MTTNPCQKKKIFLIAHKIVSIITLMFFSAGNVFALPSGQQVVNGQASFITQSNNLTVTNAPNAIINWQGFSINSNEAVRFMQQSSSSSVLNRVIGQDPSRILGLLQSNGKVFLINPNGILFGQGARIDVNGLFASTLAISNQDFLAGKFNFSAGNIAGSIQNQGTITTPTGGKVYLIAPDIENNGIINTPQGEVLLAAGHSVQLVDSLNPDIAVVVSAPENKAVNLGQIVAQSGKVGIYGGLISQKGSINADSAVVGENGRIFLKSTKDITLDIGSTTSANGPQGGQIKIQSESGTTLVSGAVTATGNIPAPSREGEGVGVGRGGDIQILGNYVGLIDNAQIDASGRTGGGTVLIGGDYQGKNPAVQNAAATYLGKDTVIKADATETGDGGKVIVWADDATRFYGNINARGGWFGGDGGFVETSGKQYLAALGTVDISARLGNGGLWFLDPNNITIQTAGPDTNIGGTPNFTTTNDSAILTIASITGVLNAGGNVSVTTGTAGTNAELGNITLADPINSNSTGSSTLTLTANNNINVNANINNTSSVGPLNVTMTATNGAITGNGALVGSQLGWLNATLNAKTGINLTGPNQVSAAVLSTSTGTGAPIVFNNALDTTTGVFNVSGTSSGSFTVTAGAGSGNVTVNNNLSAGGVIGLTAKGDITVAKPITYSGVGASTLTLAADQNIVIDVTGSISGSSGNPLNVTLNSARTTGVSGAIFMDSGSSINSFGGNVVLGGGADPLTINAVGTITYPYFNGVGLMAGATINSGAGYIRINGTGNAASGAMVPSGISIESTSTLTSTSGNITLKGQGGGAGTYPDLYGISIHGTIQSDSGTIDIAGTGVGTANSSNCYGVFLDNGIITASTGAGIIITGTGGQGGTSGNTGNMGVNLAGGSITTTGAPIIITGTGGIGASSSANYGVRLGGIAPLTISSVGGAITIVGTAGGNISTFGAEGIRAGGTPINITSTGSASISLTGVGTDIYPGILLDGNGGAISIGGASAAGNISFTAGGTIPDISIVNGDDGVTVRGIGNLFLQPVTPDTTIGIGGGNGTFTLTAAELGSLAEGFSNITIGSANQAALINVNVATFKDNLTLLAPASGGAISITADGGSGLLTSPGHNITLTSASTIAGGDIVAASLNANAVTGITLTGDVGTVSLVNSGAGNVQYENVGINPVTVNGSNGGGDFTVYSRNGGDINIGLIDNGTGYLDIQTYDNINNALGGSSTNIIGGTLNLYATYMPSATPTGIGGNGSALNTKVDILDVDNKTGTVNISNTSTLLTIGTVNNLGGHITIDNVGALTTGASAMNATGNISLSATNSLTIGAGGISATGNITLSSTGAVAQSGVITAAGLELLGTGSYTLANANVVGTLAGDAGSISFTNSSGLSIGKVNATEGLTTTGDTTLNITGTITAITPSGTVNVGGVFTLNGGTWSQVSATLPNFTATDFRIASGTFIRALSGNGTTTPYQLADIYGLQGMGSTGMLGNSYALANNIGAAGTSSWNAGTGFVPVGNSPTPFTGTFDGLGYTITGLYINRPATNYVGLFGFTDSAIISNVGLVSGTVIGQSEVGGLVGRSEAIGGGTATITNSSSSAAVSGLNRIGGLVGVQFSSGTGSSNTIESSYSNGSVTGSLNNYDAGIGGLAGFQEGWTGGASTISNSYHSTGLVSNLTSGSTGGLVGFQGANGGTPTITSSYNTAAVTGGDYVGGLVGYGGGSISDSHNTGTVTGRWLIGGLAGSNSGSITSSYNTGAVTSSFKSAGGLVGSNSGSVTNSYSIGNVSGIADVGGLVGYSSGSITNTYSTGAVTGDSDVGGLVGANDGSIGNSYSTGVVTVTSGYGGGLVGSSNGTITSSYWDTDTSGWSTSAGGTGLTTAQMMTQASYSGWNFSSPWNIVESISYPYLAWQYSGTPQIISGKIDVTGAGKTVQTAVNGSLLATAATGANGFYYFALPGNSVASGSTFLAYISGNTVKSASIYLSSGTHITGLSLNSNTVTASGATMSNTTFGTAKGALDSTDIPYTSSGNNLMLNSGFNLAMNAGGDITLNGLVDAGAGNVTLKSGGAIINGMGGATSIIAASLAAEAVSGIGSGDPLMTEVNMLAALNTTSNNIQIDNTGILTVTALSNGGSGDVILQNIGAITTDISTVTSSGGSVSITAHSPLTIGAGGVSAYGNISLAASGSDNLTIAGNIASSNGNISLMAPGGSIAVSPGISLSAPNGTVTLNTGTGTDDLATVGNNTATDNTVSSLITAMGTITSDESGDDEDERKKKIIEGVEQKADEKKTDDGKKYCN